MPTRPDLRDITTGVRDALGDTDRDALLEILTFLIKEYVVDGPPPMLLHQAETIADLNRLSFAQLITSLQTRLDLPELALFAVDGEQVSVRVGGAMHPLTAGRAGAAPVAQELPRPGAGVRVVETTLQPRPQAAAPSAPQVGTQTERGAAPPPSRGLSVRGAPAGAAEGQPAAQPGSAPPGPPSAAPPAPAPGPAPSSGDKAEGGGDDASARFSLLELD